VLKKLKNKLNTNLKEKILKSKLNVLALSLIYLNISNVLAEDVKDSNSSEDQLEEMVVTATRSEISALLAPANATVVNEKNTENRLNQRIGDALKEVPGIYLRGSAYGTSMPGSGMGGATLHGIADTRRSLFMVDGLPVNSGASNNVDWNTLNMDDAQQVEYVPGPFSALYGSSAMGGVLNVISKAPTKREGNITAGGGGGAVDQWGVKGKYRDRLANGLGISLTVNHMDSSNWADSDYLVVTPSKFANAAAMNAATPVQGAIATQSSQGVPGYWVGLKGARPWEQNNASLRLYYDLTENTKIDFGMAWNRTETGYTPYTSFLTNNGNPLSIGIGSINNPSYNLNANGQKLSLTQNQFFNLTPSSEDTRRYFTHLRHDFGGDVKLNADFQYMENTYDYVYANNTGIGQASSQPNHRIDGNVSLRFPFLWKDRNFATIGFGANNNVLDAAQKASISNWRDGNSITRIDNLGTGQSTILSGFIQDELYIRDNLIAYLGGRYDD
jgi:iron complex outermembrane receptor protein